MVFKNHFSPSSPPPRRRRRRAVVVCEARKSYDFLASISQIHLNATKLFHTHMILLEDGSLIVASGIGHEQERSSVNVVWYEKSVFKLNNNQQIDWEVSFPEDSLTSRARTTNLLNT